MIRWFATYAGPLQAITFLIALTCAITMFATGFSGGGWIFTGASLLGLLSGWGFCALCNLEEATRTTG